MKALRILAISTILLSGCLFFAPQEEPTGENIRPDSPAHVFLLLERAYETRSVSLLDQLLAPDYVFDADARSLTSSPQSQWNREEELGRHRRMFQAISGVTMTVEFTGATAIAHSAAETTWTVPRVYMDMDYNDQHWAVTGSGTQFRLRTEILADGTRRVRIVRWSDMGD